MEVDMFSRIRTALGLALLIALLALPVYAGGWAVITLDALPSKVTAGEPLIVGFTVLQHGRTPMTNLRPTITARQSLNEKLAVSAEMQGEPGHYMAELTFPTEGHWEWSIQAFTMDQPMPALSVAPSILKAEPKTTAAFSPLLIVRTFSLGIGLIGLAVAFRRKNQLAAALTTLCLLIGLTTFMVGAGPSSVEAQSGSSPDVSQVEYGRQLFLAKGCITCHYNSRAADRSEYWTIDMGAPNLSNFSASPELLRLRLKDPSSVKSNTQMPNLSLSDIEIEALIAFINSK
jgi:mono/diheme cytochrome c family protein